jgi:hypothetical protein
MQVEMIKLEAYSRSTIFGVTQIVVEVLKMRCSDIRAMLNVVEAKGWRGFEYVGGKVSCGPRGAPHLELMRWALAKVLTLIARASLIRKAILPRGGYARSL